MTAGLITFDNPGDAAAPSPSIWKGCPNTLLRDLGQGYFAHEEFLCGSTGILATTLALAQATFNGFSVNGDTDTVLAFKASERGGYLDIETDGDDNDAAALVSQPFGRIVRNSGKKLWFEARLELGAVADQGVFVGLVEEAGATRDVLSDNIASNGVITESLLGFLVDNGDTNGLDIVYRKDAGTLVNVLNDSTASSNYTAAGGTAFSLTADTEFKVGIFFDGLTRVKFFVNGYKVAEVEVDSTVDQAKDLCAIVALKTGTAAAQSIAVDWARYGFQERA